MKIRIYAAGTLTAAEVSGSLAGAQLAPPVTRGDLHRDIDAGVQIVGIVDGTFLNEVALSPLEIVDAMRVGVRVFGAGGLGALRAVELAHFGMVGCGRVFERIGREAYFRDDDLGSGPPGAASTSMVELELSCEAQIQKGRLTPATAQRLVRALRGLHFSARNFDALAEATRGNQSLRRACATVRKHHASQKRIDALEMLALIQKERVRTPLANARLNGAPHGKGR